MNLEALLAWPFPQIEHDLTARDCMLYALGIGVGLRPHDPADLQFCYEEGLQVFPSIVNVVAHPGAWVKDPALGIDWVRLLHAEQAYTVHRPLQAGRTYVGRYRIDDVLDKGPDKGALLYMTKTLHDTRDDAAVASVRSTYFLRGDGGCGGTTDEAPTRHTLPDRAPDLTLALPTLPQAALLYRLSGDYNPIHADPAVARNAGFERPILQGLCSLGVVSRALVQLCCDDQPARLKSVALRFSAPVYPGETLVTEVWRDAAGASFRARVPERDRVALDNGRVELG